MPETKATAAASPPPSSPTASSKKEATATSASPTKNNSNNNKKTKANNNNASNSKQPPREYNPLWKGYLYIVLSSLISLSSISNVRQEDFYKGNYGVGVLFATVTFSLALIILILDRTKWLTKSMKLDYAKAMDGKLEGYTLLIWTFWWIVGVAYITQVNGMAYVASNIYFSAWLSLASCIYTLNGWSTNKDLLSWDELTGISETLKSWYILFVASLVVMGTCIDLIAQVYNTFLDEAGFGLAVGFLSAGLSLFWILVHYNFVQPCGVHEGGWVELWCSFFAILIWIAGTTILTREGGIGATIVGTGCYISELEEGITRNEYENCTIIYYYYAPWTTPPQNSNSPSSSTNNSTNATTTTTTSTLNDTLSEINGTLVSPYPNSSTVMWTTGDTSTSYSAGQDDDFIQPPQNLTMGSISCLEAESRNRPGSNLYLAVWACMAASINITLRWKAQQAMQFAQAAQNRQLGNDNGGNKATDTSAGGGLQQREQQKQQASAPPNALEDDEDDDDDDDDDDDLDDFEDAYE